ncbi:PPOX class F420-dependent oxidoreductase [Rhodococcus sp. ABRD24]|uniref:PPOX class F420-dependent oxidoreductase n=1 Tax=Rhodococcus sp. ABRD24 TaxID=2507582 RepID=UPI00103D8FAB|nr:PPOX class F420-dependent oxidoreductase [Rhodococcus sp. ABRD24]QBJ94562.1 PPOX class F420-dependent oxidoreductase [Rhodococcus sp. ABRD24]
MARTPSTPAHLTDEAASFLRERHLATMTTLRKDGTPHVVAVGFTWDPERSIARVITNDTSQKARNADRGGYAAVSQVDGGRWLTLEGSARVMSDPASVAEGVERYAVRYRQPRENPTRVVIEIAVERVMGSAILVER